MMERLGRWVASSMQGRFPAGLLHKERVAILSEVMNELGYRSRVKQSDVRKGLVIEASNCAYHLVARSNPELCNLDRSFPAAASGGMKVTQDQCIRGTPSVASASSQRAPSPTKNLLREGACWAAYK
jgi:DeoR family transcriptional regulator, suf operon transcriptional repressor